MNNLYRHLDLPFEIKPPTELLKIHYDYPFNVADVTELCGYTNDEVQDFIRSLDPDLTLDYIEGFYTPPGGSIPVHNDGDILCKMNQSFGEEGGILRWWEASETFKKQPDVSDDQRQYEGDAIDYADRDKCTYLDEVNTNVPTLINTNVLHDTYNPPDAPGRWTLCFKPLINLQPITWDQGIELFKDYIIGEAT